jgi:hypothetical protein
MHTVRFKDAATLQDVIERVVDRRTADPAAVINRVAELNPHIDLSKKKKIPPGAVLILPDEPGIRRGDKKTESREKLAYDALGSAVFAGFEAAAKRVGSTVEAAEAERAELVAAMKSAIAKRQMESDPALHKQLGEALATAERRQKERKEAAANLDALQKTIAEELKAMEKLFR